MHQKGFVWAGLLLTAALIVVAGSFFYFKKSLSTNLVETPTAPSSPKPSTAPAPTPKVSGGIYNLGVLVIKYFPVTQDGNIDTSITGDIGDPYETIRQNTISVTNNLKNDLSKASKYLGYKNLSVPSSLTYQIVNTYEHEEGVPFDPTTRKPQYKKILQDHNICDYVNNKNVKEVWLWAYQGPNKSDGQPFLAISESKMSGPFGDISNSSREGDMPACKYTYRVYTFNYGRGTSEALESWGHQMESELDAVDEKLFRNKFQGPNYPPILGQPGRCGSVHNPPNARFEYDRENPTPYNSDCLDWNPSSLGSISQISCKNWGCGSNGDDTPSRRYMVWMWQNLPGLNNTKIYNGKALRNWWDIHGDFDNVMANSRKLTK